MRSFPQLLTVSDSRVTPLSNGSVKGPPDGGNRTKVYWSQILSKKKCIKNAALHELDALSVVLCSAKLEEFSNRKPYHMFCK